MTRQDLYDLVWQESMLSLSKKYSISGTGLKKKCKTLKIPVPEMGYWAKLQFGKAGGRKTPLPVFDGDQTVILYLREENDPTKESRNEIIKQLEKDESLKITVPEKLVNPDKLIVAVKDDIFKRRVWNKNEDIVYNSSGYLSIRVSPQNIHRALILMDTLIKVLKQRGHSVTIEYNTTYFFIEGEKIPICCRESKRESLLREPTMIVMTINQPGCYPLKSMSPTQKRNGPKEKEPWNSYCRKSSANSNSWVRN